MNNKNMYMILGAIAVVAVGYYIYNKNKKASSTTTPTKPNPPVNTTEEEPKSNFRVGDRIGNDCLCYPASARIWSPTCCQVGRGGA